MMMYVVMMKTQLIFTDIKMPNLYTDDAGRIYIGDYGSFCIGKRLKIKKCTYTYPFILDSLDSSKLNFSMISGLLNMNQGLLIILYYFITRDSPNKFSHIVASNATKSHKSSIEAIMLPTGNESQSLNLNQQVWQYVISGTKFSDLLTRCIKLINTNPIKQLYEHDELSNYIKSQQYVYSVFVNTFGAQFLRNIDAINSFPFPYITVIIPDCSDNLDSIKSIYG
jgi:hypothetical protein